MASNSATGTGMSFVVIGCVGLCFAGFSFLLPSGMVPGHPNNEGGYFCLGVSCLLLIVGLTLAFVGFVSSREANLPIARFKSLPLTGVVVLLAGLIHAYVTGDLSSTNRTPLTANKSEGYDVISSQTQYQVNRPDWTKIESARGVKVDAVVENGMQAFANPCGTQSIYILSGRDFYMSDKQGHLGRKTQIPQTKDTAYCWNFQSMTQDAVTITATFSGF